MNAREFNRAFQIDRSAKGVKALAKPVPSPVVLTADGKPFDPTKSYYFHDGQEVRESKHFQRIDSEHLGSLGMRVVPISELRESVDSALEDAQESVIKQIDRLRDQVRDLEERKSPERRTMRYILRSRG